MNASGFLLGFALAVAVGYGYNVGNNLVTALVHCLGIGRYSHVQLSTTLLTQAMSLWLFVEVLAHKFTPARPSEPAA